MYAEALANTLAVHLLKRYSASERPVTDVVGELPKHKLRRATEFINDNLGRDIALAEIVPKVEMSPYYFARLFKQSTGLLPHQYLLEQRVKRAKILLTETAIPSRGDCLPIRVRESAISHCCFADSLLRPQKLTENLSNLWQWIQSIREHPRDFRTIITKSKSLKD